MTVITQWPWCQLDCNVMTGYLLQEICSSCFFFIFWNCEEGIYYVTEVLMQNKLCMFIINSFEHACLTCVYATPVQTVSDVWTRRPSFHPTELHVGFRVHTVKIRCLFCSVGCRFQSHARKKMGSLERAIPRSKKRKFVPVHTMKSYRGRGSIAPLILNLGT